MARPEYHWLVTLQWTDPTGQTMTRTGHGKIEPGKSATRENLTADVLAHARQTMGVTGEPAVLCFVLEPNELPQPKPKKPKKN